MAEAGFDEVVAELANFFSVSKTLGGNVALQAEHLQKAADLSKAFICKALTTKKPDDAKLGEMLTPISTEMQKIGEIKDKSRGDKNFNHITAVAEAVQAFGWVAMDGKPGPFVKETTGSAQFWTNKILKDFKGKDESHVNWANSLVAFLQALEKYIMQYHTTGVAWNSGGAKPAAAAAVAVASGGASLTDFDQLVDEHLKPYVALSTKIGDVVQKQAALVETAVAELRKLIEHAGKTKPKVTGDAFQNLLGPIVAPMTQIGELKDKNRSSKYYDHLTAVAEAIGTLGWVTVEPAPAPFAKDTAAGAVFFTNKILKVYKGKEEDHVEWVKHLNGFFQGMEGYIKQHHMTGLSWGTGSAKPVAVVAAPTSSSGAVADFQTIIDDFVVPYVELSKKLGGVVAQQADLVLEAVKKEKDLIENAKKQKKPADEQLVKLLEPINTPIMKVSELKEKNRKDPHWNHLSAVAEGISILGWVAVEPTPGPFAKEVIPSSEFWSNKILKEVRGKDETQENWIKSFNGFLKAIPTYIQQHHTTGLSWSK